MQLDLVGYVLIALIIFVCFRIYQETDMLQLKCIESDKDGLKYCVRERSKLTLAADRLAEINKRMQKIVKHLGDKYPDRDNVKRLVEGYNPKALMETLPTSELTAYSQNKGEKMAFCLNKEKNGDELIDINTLMFVALHELSHIATKSINHTPEFWSNFKFILTEAKPLDIYDMKDYKKDPVRYCGMDIRDNPYFDWKG